jgi:hypothetical protein
MEHRLANVVIGTETGDDWTIYGQPVLGRACGSCKSCCTLVPVERPLNKPAMTKCQFLNHKGCSIYAERPDVRRYWSCRWLFDPTTAGMKRPDHMGYLIDCMLDTIIVDGDKEMQVVQIWVDPARSDAHRDPALRSWLQAKRLPAIVRYGSADAMLIAPPPAPDGEWIERTSEMLTREAMDQRRVEIRDGARDGSR